MTIDASLNERLRNIERKHQKMRRNGVVHEVGKDGLIRSRPRLVRPKAPLMGVLTIAVLLIVFKALLFAQIGPDAYAQRVEVLRSGTLFQQAGAVFLQEDRISTGLAEVLGRYIQQP